MFMKLLPITFITTYLYYSHGFKNSHGFISFKLNQTEMFIEFQTFIRQCQPKRRMKMCYLTNAKYLRKYLALWTNALHKKYSESGDCTRRKYDSKNKQCFALWGRIDPNKNNDRVFTIATLMRMNTPVDHYKTYFILFEHTER